MKTQKTPAPARPEEPEAHFAVSGSVPTDLVPIGEEFARLEESARWSSQNQFEAAKSWQSWNFRLGVPASVFGFFSGGAAFTEALPGWVVGSAALIGAALAGIMTVLTAERRAQRAKTCANTFHDIQDDARRALLIDLPRLNRDDARVALTVLTERYSETRHTADAPSAKFYTRAKRNIQSGGQQFAIDVAKTAQPSGRPTPPTTATPEEN